MAGSMRLVGPILGLVCVCLSHSPAITPADASTNQATQVKRPPEIRTAGHDPANVLYLFARAYGAPTSYESVARALPPAGQRVTLLDMRTAAAQLDLTTEVVRWTPAEALRAEKPVITLLDAPPPLQPEYILIVGPARDDRVLYVAGTTASVQAMSEDEFRRRWSGLVLAPSPAKRAWPLAVAAGAVLGGGYAAFLWWRRRREPHPVTTL